MFHAERLCSNPLTGRKVWLLRHIPHDGYGGNWKVSVVIVRRHYFGRNARLMGAEKITGLDLGKQLRGCLAKLGFHSATGLRHGREKTYRVKTRGRR